MMRAAIFLATVLYASTLWATEVQEVKAGGNTAWLIEDHALPIVTLKVLFRGSGSAYDPQGKEGLSTLASQLFDEGAGDMDALTFHRALEEHAIRFGAESNEDSLLASMQTLSEFKPEALKLFKLALASPRFDDDAVERIRAATQSELRELASNPGYQASLHWKSYAFAGHAYAHPRLGTQESVAAITRDDLRSFARMQFDCHPRIISVVGDITASEVKDWLATFAGKAQNCEEPPVLGEVTVAAGGEPYIVHNDVPQTIIQAGLPSVGRNDPRYYSVYVLNHILGGNSLTSRLGKEIRDKRGLAYYAESEVENLDHCPYILMQFATRNKEAMGALGIFQDQLTRIAHDGVTQQELDDAKKYITGSFPLQIDSESALADYLLSMQHYGLGIDYLQKRNGFMDAVTLAQVNDMAKTIFTRAPLIVMVGDPEQKQAK